MIQGNINKIREMIFESRSNTSEIISMNNDHIGNGNIF